MAWSRSTERAEHIRTLDTFEEAVLSRLRVIVAQKATELAERARSKVNGRLASTLKVRTVDNQYAIKGIVYSKWYVARFFERGYGGKVVQVKAHERRVRSQDVRERVMTAKGTFRSRIASKGRGHVVAHSRQIPRIHRPYIGAALEELRASIRNAMDEAIKGAANVTRS